MKKINKKNMHPLVLLSGLLLSTGASAAQLGKLEVVSSANEPFLAKIQIQSLRPEERKGLQAKLASGEAFKAARLDMDPRLSSLKFEIKTGASADSAVIQISSDKPLGKNFLDALVELSWSGGRVSREYTFTPAEEKAPTPKPESPEVRPPQVNVVPAPKKEPEKPSGSVADSSSEDASIFQYLKPNGRKGEQPVQKGQTLSGIASKLAKENGVSLNQAMATVYEANRDAFSGNSVHRLKAGANLVIPNQAAFQARTEKEALVVLARNDDRNVYSRYAQQLGLLTSIEPALAAPSSGTQSQGKVEAGSQIVPTPSRGYQLKIAPSGSASAKADAAAEELTARTKALGEANERIALLEKNVSDLQKLLEMQKDVAEPVKPVASSDDVAAVQEEPKPAVEDASSNKAEVQNETLSKAEEEKKEELHPSENEEKKQPEESAGLLPWLLGGAGAALLSVIGLLVWRSRAKRKSEEPIVPQEPSFEQVIPEDQLMPVVSSEASSKPTDQSLAVASNDAFDLESLLDAQSEPPQRPVELDARPVQPEPVVELEKAEFVEASVLQETSVQNVDLEFPDEPETPVENSILDDLDMLAKGAESAQAELQAMRETPKEADLEEMDEPSESEVDADLDLDVPEPPKEPIDEAVWQEVATKLDLAGAYVEIGDADGAKELLNEILKKGDVEQIEKAKALLETLN